MFDVSAIYGYLGTLKHEPSGDFGEFQLIVKDSEIAFRNALTQCVLEKDGKGAILFQRDFEDLLTTMQSGLNDAIKGKDKEKTDWLSFQVKKTEEAVQYIKRVQKDLTNPSIDSKSSATSQPNEGIIEKTKVISGTQGLASFLGCGKTKAFEIIKSGILKDKGIQYQVGKCWKFNAIKLTQYLKENPNLLQ